MGVRMIRIAISNILVYQDESFFKTHYALVSEDRKKKIDQYARQEDKWRSLGAYMLLCKMIADETARTEATPTGAAQKGSESEADTLVFITGEHGKPVIKGMSGFYFNLSHSGNYVACVISDGEVGIDIQNRTKSNERIAERVFESWKKDDFEFGILPGTDCLCITSAQDKEMRFCEMWCLTESQNKLTGMGLSKKKEKDNAVMSTRLFDVDHDYKMAVSTFRGKIPDSFEIIHI